MCNTCDSEGAPEIERAVLVHRVRPVALPNTRTRARTRDMQGTICVAVVAAAAFLGAFALARLYATGLPAGDHSHVQETFNARPGTRNR